MMDNERSRGKIKPFCERTMSPKTQKGTKNQ